MIDNSLILKEAGLVAASTAGSVVNVGSGFVAGNLVVDVAAVEVASGNELYTIKLQGSLESDFSADYDDLAMCALGATAVVGGDVLGTTGRFVIPFRNERNATVYPYLREYCACSGSIATGINFTCHLTP